MRCIKSVWQYHDKYEEFKPLFDYFKNNVNVAIRTRIEKNLTSKFNLQHEVYHKLKSEFHTKYIHGSLECASARLKIFRKSKRKNPKTNIPFVTKNHLILDNQSYKIFDDSIRIPIRPHQYCIIKLNRYVLKQIQNVKLGSITIMENKISISYSNQIREIIPIDFMAIDRNLNNLTTCNTKDEVMVHDLQKVNQIKQTYRQVKARFRRKDARIRRRIFAKYGKKEKNRVHDILHKASKKIVNQNMGIILEDLKGIRKLYHKGNGQGKNFRARMNSWSFYELQRQIEYKARWRGLPVKYVKATGTSSKCATCGSKMVPEEHRTLFCSCCNVAVDRDINAAKNILARGTRVVPVGTASEAMMWNVEKPLILRVDAVQLFY